jgi:hypothetical protein
MTTATRSIAYALRDEEREQKKQPVREGDWD